LELRSGQGQILATALDSGELSARRSFARRLSCTPTAVQYARAMPRPLRLTICPLAATAVLLVSGCGSAKKASTDETASTNNATTSAPARTTGQSKSSTQAQHATKTRQPKAAKAKPQPKEKAAEAPSKSKQREAETQKAIFKQEAERHAAATPTLQAAERQLPLSRRYPKFIQGKFLLACRAAKGSKSSCECIVAKQELNLKVEQGQSIAELLALEIAFRQEHASLADIRRHRVLSPRNIREVARKCK